MITLPIYWEQKYKTKPNKTHLVGMNAYHNWHHMTYQNFKKEFHSLVIDQCSNSDIIKGFTLDINLYYKNKTCDASNIVALIEKVLLDALQSAGVITNDNVQFHLGTTWRVAGQDRDNPRCDITIKEQK
jgi:Holliday junction resolvase RusA-like endonuclease